MNKPHARFWIIGLAVGVLLSSGCSLLTPSSSSMTPSSSAFSSSSVVSLIEEVPEIIYEGESRLIYNEEESRRELSLLSGESRKLHFRLSDNDGAYVLSFAAIPPLHIKTRPTSFRNRYSLPETPSTWLPIRPSSPLAMGNWIQVNH